MTSHRAVVVTYQAPWVRVLVHVLVPSEYSCRKYQTGNQCTKPLLHHLGRVALKPDKPQIVAAYKKPIVEAFFYPSVYVCPGSRGNLM